MADVKVEIAWTDDEVDQIVTGSGAESYPWYLSDIRPSEVFDGCYFVTLDDGDDSVPFTFSRDDFRDVAREVAEGEHGIRGDIRKYIIDDDLDADTVDCIIQILCFGEAIFG